MLHVFIGACSFHPLIGWLKQKNSLSEALKKIGQKRYWLITSSTIESIESGKERFYFII